MDRHRRTDGRTLTCWWATAAARGQNGDARVSTRMMTITSNKSLSATLDTSKHWPLVAEKHINHLSGKFAEKNNYLFVLLLAGPTWLCGHNSLPASSVMDFIYCHPDSSQWVMSRLTQSIHLYFGLLLFLPSPESFFRHSLGVVCSHVQNTSV